MPAFRQRHDAKVSFDPPLWLQVRVKQSQSENQANQGRRAAPVVGAFAVGIARIAVCMYNARRQACGVSGSY